MKSWVRPSKTEKKVIEYEARKVFAEHDRKNVREIEAITLWVLHEMFGFGPKRLRRFYFAFHKYIRKLLERYVMEESDMDWLCTRKLKEIGVDVEQWREELGDVA